MGLSVQARSGPKQVSAVNNARRRNMVALTGERAKRLRNQGGGDISYSRALPFDLSRRLSWGPAR
jgi:hypothetical protein